MKYIYKRQNLLHINKTTEAGRGLVEMLAVLAIISILSITGIMGYTFAMNKYQANDIVNAVNLRNRDTWNLYQTKDLPMNGGELDEWDSKTPTGFPIGVYPRSPFVFDVEVEAVPFQICRQVMQSHIDGPLFIWTRGAEDTKQIFTGHNSIEICGDDKTNIVFTTSLEAYGELIGLRENLKDETGRPIRYCLEDTDCNGRCESCSTDYTCYSTCPDSKPICSLNGCVECEANMDCSGNKICNETTNQCELPPTACNEGEFRTKNGACAPCDTPANIKIDGSDDPFGEDKLTGKQMCATCKDSGTERVTETAGNDTTYCSYTCTLGVSYQRKDGTCAPCYGSDGKPSTDKNPIRWATESIKQCLACPNHVWQANYWAIFCRPKFEGCPTGYFIAQVNDSSFECVPCSEKEKMMMFYRISSSESTFNREYVINACNSCPEWQNGVYTARYASQRDYNKDIEDCWPKCQQPTDETESVQICQNNPADKLCTRKWQNNQGSCFSCGSTTSNNYINQLSADAQNLCTQCGRKIVNGRCVPNDKKCSLGSFLSLDGSCVPCSNKDAHQIESENVSGCISLCKQNDAKEYDLQGNTETRWLVSSGNYHLCLPKNCESGKFVQSQNGECISCENETTIDIGGYTELKNMCTECTPQRSLNEGKCGLKQCPIGKNNEKQFHNHQLDCVSCNIAEPIAYDTTLFNDCNQCENRMLFSKRDTCVLVNNGVSGVCNSFENKTFENYPAGDKKLYRDYEGYCRSCTDKNAYRVDSYVQCQSCGNRRMEGDFCMYGLCTDSSTFLNTESTCIDCATKTVKTKILTDDISMTLCNSCPDKRVMTSGFTHENNLKAYCVPECIGAQLQGLSEGVCVGCTEKNSNIEIGSDDLSIAQCRNCERVAFSRESNEKTHWYCSEIPTKGSNFININGKAVNCSNEEDIEILNVNDARNLCNECETVKRQVIKKDDLIYCRKSSTSDI